VAIKRINNIFSSYETSKRIYRELRLLRTINHPNIVKIVHVQQPRWAAGRTACLTTTVCCEDGAE
jgi:serine/threonine protein kinase